MNIHKQMCWCFKVFSSVFSNLTHRLLSELLFVSYKMCFLCCKGPNELLKETEEEFYKDVSRAEAENLLKNKQDGTFIIRPSRSSPLGTMSLVQDARVFHLNIRRRDADGLVALGSEKADEKCFRSLDALINYYISNYLVLYSNGNGESTAALLLPFREKAIC